MRYTHYRYTLYPLMKKLYRSLFITLSLLVSFSGAAVTVDQLVANGGQGIVNLYGCYKTGSRLTASRGVTFTKVSDTRVKIKGLYFGQQEYTFTLSNDATTSSCSATTDGTKLAIYYGNADPSGWKLEAGFIYSNGREQAYNFKVYDYAVFEIVTNADGTYTLTSTTPLLFADPSIYDVPFSDIFDTVEIHVLVPDAKASQTVKGYNYRVSSRQVRIYGVSSSVDEEYLMNVDIDPSTGRFSMLNLANYGYGVDSRNNAVQIDGTIDFASGEVAFDDNQYAYVSDQWGSTSGSWGGSSSTNFKQYEYYTLTGFDNSSTYAKFPSLKGTYSEKVAHNDAEFGWVTNGGERRTFAEYSLALEPMTYYTTASVNNSVDFRGSSFNDIAIDGLRPLDITLETALAINDFSFDDNNNIHVNATLSAVANDRYLDNCQLCIVPGAFSSVSDEGFDAHVDLGHSQATVLDETDFVSPLADAVPQSVSNSGDKTVDLTIPQSALSAVSPTNTYTLFIKANYRNGNGVELTPTFHNLSTRSVSTSITPVAAENDPDAAPVIYNLLGVRVKDMSSPGIYIVNGVKRVVR